MLCGAWPSCIAQSFVGTSITSKKRMEEKSSHLLVLYASQTGNAMDAAERVGREAERGGCPSVQVLPIDRFDVVSKPIIRPSHVLIWFNIKRPQFSFTLLFLVVFRPIFICLLYAELFTRWRNCNFRGFYHRTGGYTRLNEGWTSFTMVVWTLKWSVAMVRYDVVFL